jgi:hypothetical protein
MADKRQMQSAHLPVNSEEWALITYLIKRRGSSIGEFLLQLAKDELKDDIKAVRAASEKVG